MDETQNEDLEDKNRPEEETVCDKPPLDMAEDYINWGEFEKAQEILNTVNEKSGRKFYLQSRIYKSKCWYNEQRKLLKAAIKADPENEEYKKELGELEQFSKTKEYKSAVRKQQMGQAGNVCAEGCAEGCCYCVCGAICEGLGNGC